ncbi:MAG: primosomal protein N' [Eubacteriaceae bacterium]|nr:primosomal protein N' [Eubacteriaceae bacterium]
MKIAQIYVNQLNINLDRAFDYLVPESLHNTISAGDRVMVPFGFGNKKIDGVVYKITDFTDYPTAGLKNISGIIENYPKMTENQLKVCKWMQEKYHCFFMDGVNSYMPSNLLIKSAKDSEGKRIFYISDSIKREKVYRLTDQDKNLEACLSRLKKNASSQHKIIKALHSGPLSYKELKERALYNKPSLDALIGIGMIMEEMMEESEQTDDALQGTFPKIKLNAMQKTEFDKYQKSEHDTFLLHGVTGSGKTEIYLQMMEEMIKEGRSCLYLVPEIALTPQTIGRIKGRFNDKVAVIHSRIKDSQRFVHYMDIYDNKTKIVIGARSGIFSPFKDLGLIIIDEEHENTYKSGSRPRYDTIETARYLKSLYGAKLVLGSATPSVISYHKALNGEYQLLHLPERINAYPLPEVEVVDMRNEMRNGNRSFLSKGLFLEMKEKLRKKEQIILFLNKRGFYSYVFCRDCGYAVKCPKCDVAMTYHSTGNRLECHYCGHVEKVERICPSCGSSKIKYSGTGTERIENSLVKYFPDVKILRMDTDTMKKKDSFENTLNAFSKGEADILIGTQMVTKGFDFDNVTLVGVLLADLTLNFPDYRASERTFQLITQVAGRAGRGDKEGKVFIQTYDPDHYVIRHAKTHDYIGFYREEIKYREERDYPPFTQLLYIGFSGEDLNQVTEDCRKYYDKLLLNLESNGFSDYKKDIYQPSLSSVSRINNKHRWYILIKTEHIEDISGMIRQMSYSNEIKNMGSAIIIDLNPNTLL